VFSSLLVKKKQLVLQTFQQCDINQGDTIATI